MSDLFEGVSIRYIGGNCPVQAEGFIDDKEFYFRSRGDSWSMKIGGSDIIGNPEWKYEEDYGKWPEAGWIDVNQAISFMRKAFSMWREQNGQVGSRCNDGLS